ncbi:MAG: hypothetical protein WBH40_14050 [Ignavibacteriaceae bacterium]
MRTYNNKSLVTMLVIATLTFLGSSCEQDPIIGPDPGKDPIRVSFTITSQLVTSTKLSVSGRVKNIGSNTITAYWYIEGQFYADNTYSLLLGGDVTTINLPLNPGVETLWNLELSDPEIAEGNYPNFAVRDLVAYYTK